MNKYLRLEIMTKGRFLIFLISDLIENYTYNKIVFSINIVSNYGIIFYFCYIELIISLHLKYKYKMITGESILNFVHNITKYISSSIYILKFKKKKTNEIKFLKDVISHIFFSLLRFILFTISTTYPATLLRLLIYFPTSGSDPRKKSKIPVEWQIPATDPEIDFTVVQWETIRGRSSYIKSLERANRIGVQHQTLISSTTSDSVATRASIKGQPDRVIERPFTLPSPPCVDVEISDNTH